MAETKSYIQDFNLVGAKTDLINKLKAIATSRVKHLSKYSFYLNLDKMITLCILVTFFALIGYL